MFFSEVDDFDSHWHTSLWFCLPILYNQLGFNISNVFNANNQLQYDNLNLICAYPLAWIQLYQSGQFHINPSIKSML